MRYQQTIGHKVSMSGIGLHSGKPVEMAISAAGADTGILFRAKDGTIVPASVEHVVDTRSATSVGVFGVRVRTIEHMMAALAGLGIDNAIIDLDGEELPAADGSAKPFVELIQSAGRVALAAPRRCLVVEEPIRVGDEHRWLEVTPSDTFRISYTLDNNHPAIGLQVASFAIDEPTFEDEVAPARTYGFLKDVPYMREHGLALGGSLENAIVVGKRIVLNDTLRFPDEFVRHKILDLIGDLHTLGRDLVGHVVGKNAGHTLNHELVAAIRRACSPDRRRVVTTRMAATAPSARSRDAVQSEVSAR